MTDFTGPVRICCGQRHWTTQCPDGLTMCCLCFSRFSVEELSTDEEGCKQDVCIACEPQLHAPPGER